ncbi:MAG: chloride channel protein, partial [Bacteroidetes bacterium]
MLSASVSAAITSRFFLGDEVLFHFSIQDRFEFQGFFHFILLGIICGLFSTYFSKIYFKVSDFFEKISSKKKRVLIAGTALGVLVFFFPPLYGEGFSTINALIEGDVAKTMHNSLFYEYRNEFSITVIFLLFTVLLKALATSLTFGGGGVGGIFAPTLFMGSILGFLYALIMNHYDFSEVSFSNFTLVAMAGLMAGNLQAPLTAIFLIAEITGGYALFIPLMITTSISFLTVKLSLPYSVYTLQLAKRGELITHHKDKAVLTLMNLQEQIETDFSAVSPDMFLGDLIKVISKSKRNLFPVTDNQNILLGIVYLDDIREMIFDSSLYNKVKVSEIMVFPGYWINYNEDMESVMEKFEKSGAWNLPVVKHGEYIG